MKLLAILIISVILLSGCGSEENPGVEITTPTIDTPSTEEQIAQKENIIEMTSSGFSPNSLTINKGDSVKFINKDSGKHWPASDIHPTHTVYPGSDIKKCFSGDSSGIFDACKGLSEGESFTFTFNEIDEWNFHNHLKPTNTGTITVK